MFNSCVIKNDAIMDIAVLSGDPAESYFDSYMGSKIEVTPRKQKLINFFNDLIGEL